MLQIALAVVLAAAFIPVAAAFTSSSTFRPAGQGASQTSGYAVSNVHFSPDARNPANLSAVSFSIEPANARSVRVQLSTNGAWYTCTDTAGAVTCPATAPVSAATGLNVVAYG